MARQRKRGPKTPWQQRARYNRARCTERLKPVQVANLTEADAFAGRIGRPLNAFITIKLSECAHPLQAFQRASKSISDWFRRLGGELHWIYVWENRGGFHLHALAHAPPSLKAEFSAACSKAFAGHDVQVKRRIPGPSAMAYLCKGTDAATHMKLRGPSRLNAKPQGKIAWKRCGTSKSIGETARRKTHFANAKRASKCAEKRAGALHCGARVRMAADAQGQ